MSNPVLGRFIYRNYEIRLVYSIHNARNLTVEAFASNSEEADIRMNINLESVVPSSMKEVVERKVSDMKRIVDETIQKEEEKARWQERIDENLTVAKAAFTEITENQ